MTELRLVDPERDLVAALELRNRIFADDPLGIDLYRQRLANPLRRDFFGLWNGEPVAVGFAQPHFDSPSGATAFAGTGVLPAFRRRGIGSALARATSEHARSIGKTSLLVQVRDDDEAALAFVRRRGFAEAGRLPRVALDLLALAESPEPTLPAGVELVSLAGREDLDAALYEVSEAELDMPRPEPVERPSYEEWRTHLLDPTIVARELSFAALADGRPVGYAVLERATAGRGWHAMTAVARPWRGRGLATALKQAQIAAAHRAGLVELATMNDEPNHAMRAVNAKLGYRPIATILMLRGPLQD